jgi:hypothetical protein
MRSLLILFILLISNNINGQNRIQGYVLDSQTKKGIQYSIVSEIDQKYGSYSDTTGIFTIYFITEKDSIKVSSLGYLSKNITIQDLIKKPIIELQPNPFMFKEVVVTSKNKKIQNIEIGHFTKKTNLVVAVVYPLNIQTTFIDCPKELYHSMVKTIKFAYQCTSRNYPLRIRMLNVKQNGEPGEDIISENLIINKFKSGNTQIAEIDISKQNIQMPSEGVFILFEWVMDKLYQNSSVKEGIPGPYICAIKAPSAPAKWITSYNSSKWIQVENKNILSVGIILKDYK